MKESETTSFLKSVDLCFNKAAEALKLPRGWLGKFALVTQFAK